jgi:hypothetical protein
MKLLCYLGLHDYEIKHFTGYSGMQKCKSCDNRQNLEEFYSSSDSEWHEWVDNDIECLTIEEWDE